MDPETALEFVKQGAILLLLDVPQHTVIGIDTQVCESMNENYARELSFVDYISVLMIAVELKYCLQMFSSGPNFKGIKMIPPGIHFIYYSSSNRLAGFNF